MQDNIDGYNNEETLNSPTSNNNNNTAAAANAAAAQETIRAQDTRALELEQLRKRNVAKTMQEQLDGKGQPITKETFYQQQKHQLELIKQQKLDAEANLHNFRNKIVSVSDSTKEELKKKEMEAAALLHSYRGKPEAILSHQVKKFSNNVTGSSRENLQQYVEVVTPSSRSDDFVVNYSQAKSMFDGVSDDENVSYLKQQGSGKKNSFKEENTDDVSVDDFLASLDKEVMSTSLDRVNLSSKMHDTMSNVDIHDEMVSREDHEATVIRQKNSESSNEHSTESTGWVVLEDQKEKQEMECNSNSDQVIFEELEERNVTQRDDSQTMQEWNIQYITVSFDLLTDEYNAPPVENGHGYGDLLSNLIKDMQVVVEASLQQLSSSGDVMIPDFDYKVNVVRDGKILFMLVDCCIRVVMFAMYLFMLCSFI
jgi:hypothetical protein